MDPVIAKVLQGQNAKFIGGIGIALSKCPGASLNGRVKHDRYAAIAVCQKRFSQPSLR